MVEASSLPSPSLLLWALRQVHNRCEELVSELDETQLRWHPQPGAHSLIFVFWHIARCDDNYLRAHVQGRTEVWQEEEWHVRWGMDAKSTGMLLSDDEAADLPLPPIEEITGYARRVWDEVESFVRGLAPGDLEQTVHHVDRTSSMTVGELLLSHIYGHDSRHLGEMEYIKGLLGLRGSATM